MMINEILQQNTTEQKQSPFGTRLQSAREAAGLERKDAALQLRLNEKVIIMMEKDRYPVDLPITFIRGYLRSYAKLLQIPDHEVRKALEQIKPKVPIQPVVPTLAPLPVTSGNYFMQIFTCLIIMTLIGLLAIWWYSHGTNNPPPINTVEKQMDIMSNHYNPSLGERVASGTKAIPPAIEIKPATPLSIETQKMIPKGNQKIANPTFQGATQSVSKESKIKYDPLDAELVTE